jgi:hypothetical protein
LTCIPTDLDALSFETNISIPFVFRKVIEAIYPLQDNSAATKYSPETPVKIGDTFITIFLDKYL